MNSMSTVISTKVLRGSRGINYAALNKKGFTTGKQSRIKRCRGLSAPNSPLSIEQDQLLKQVAMELKKATKTKEKRVKGKSARQREQEGDNRNHRGIETWELLTPESANAIEQINTGPLNGENAPLNSSPIFK